MEYLSSLIGTCDTPLAGDYDLISWGGGGGGGGVAMCEVFSCQSQSFGFSVFQFFFERQHALCLGVPATRVARTSPRRTLKPHLRTTEPTQGVAL